MQFKNSPRRFCTPVISQEFTGNSIFEVEKNPHSSKMGIFQKIHCSDLTKFRPLHFRSFQISQEIFIPPPNIQKSQSKFHFQLVKKVKIRSFHFFSKIRCNDIRTVKCCISGWTRAYNQATQNKPRPDPIGLIFNIPPTARTVNQHTPGGLLFLIISRSSKFCIARPATRPRPVPRLIGC